VICRIKDICDAIGGGMSSDTRVLHTDKTPEEKKDTTSAWLLGNVKALISTFIEGIDSK